MLEQTSYFHWRALPILRVVEEVVVVEVDVEDEVDVVEGRQEEDLEDGEEGRQEEVSPREVLAAGEAASIEVEALAGGEEASKLLERVERAVGVIKKWWNESDI